MKKKYKIYSFIDGILWLVGIALVVYGIILLFKKNSAELIENEGLIVILDEAIIIGIGVLLPALVARPFGNYVHKHCSKCYEELEDCHYEWTVLKNKSYKASGDRLTFQIKYNLIYYCPHCQKKFTEKISQFSEHGYSDCENKMNSYCINKFGH